MYTWWGDRIQEDLRHEFTHGLLHACLETFRSGSTRGWPNISKSPARGPAEVNLEHCPAARRRKSTTAGGRTSTGWKLSKKWNT